MIKALERTGERYGKTHGERQTLKGTFMMEYKEISHQHCQQNIYTKRKLRNNRENNTITTIHMLTWSVYWISVCWRNEQIWATKQCWFINTIYWMVAWKKSHTYGNMGTWSNMGIYIYKGKFSKWLDGKFYL